MRKSTYRLTVIFSTILALLLICLFRISYNDDPVSVKPPRNLPNVLLICCDALRCSHLGCYGYTDKPTSPFLDLFAQKGIRFTNAYSQSSHTRLSIASLFTGLLPPQHHVRIGAVLETGFFQADTLPQDLTTLAQIFQEHGYRTMAVMTNPHLNKTEGFDKGFHFFSYAQWRRREEKLHLITGMAVNKQVIKLMEREQDPGKPFFFYVHYMDVHQPYTPPTDLKKKFTEGMKPYPPISGNGPYPRGPYPPGIIEYSVALYDAEIAFWDSALKELIQEFEQRGFLKNTIVVLLADHGEEFMDHGGAGHGFTVYDEMTHIPLIITGKGIIPENMVRNDTVQMIDLFPSLCYLAEIPTTGLTLPGINIFDSRSVAQNPDRNVYAETWQGRAPSVIRNNEFKLIYDINSRSFELYDLLKDPKEQHNIYAKDHPEAAKLTPLLLEILGTPAEKSKVQERALTEDQIDELRGLGYVK